MAAATPISIKATQLYSREAMAFLLPKLKEFDSKTQAFLKQIKDNRSKGLLQGQQEIEYRLATTKAGALGFGRLYSKGPGLEALQSECRATLCADYYHDLDMVNAQPTIMAQYVRRKLSQDMPLLEEYIENRDALLNVVMETANCNRDSAKEEVLKVLFNGNPAVECLRPLSQEIRKIAKEIARMPEHRQLFEMSSKDNQYGSCLSMVMQTEERRCMLAMRDWCLANDLSPDILTYDGIMIRKKEGFSITEELLASISAAIETATGYRIQIKEKPLTGFHVEPVQAIGPDKFVTAADYAAMKADFESRAGFLAPAGKYYMVRNNMVEFYDKETAHMVFGPLWNFPIPGQFEPVWFFPLWNKDPARSITASITINPEDAGPGVLVLPFCPMWKSGQPPADAATRVEFFRGFLAALVPDEEMRSCLTEWMAQLIQQPFKNSLTCPVLAGIKGCGKDTLGDFIGEWLIGGQYSINYDSSEQFWSPYDTGRHNRIFAKLEEASGAMNRQHEAALKARITASTITINPKNVKPFTDRNFCRLLMTTNEANPVKMDEHERRFLLIHCGGSKVGDMAYFADLRRLLFCKEGAAAVGAWLEGLSIGAFPRVLPRSALALDMIEDSKTVEVQWLESDDPWDRPEMTAGELFPAFKQWCYATGKEPTKNFVWFGRNLGQAALDMKVQRRMKDGRSIYSKLPAQVR